MILKLGVQQRGLRLYNVSINDDPRLTLIGPPMRLNGHFFTNSLNGEKPCSK